ncbi:MAG: hypothetical protein EBQ89_01230 [Alphaproteobacteria bacterium]|nr:hypothetical protein [Alphaproteobacteria bacterium]NDG03412.1 hypothetical protein [Synechococcaceae bacterium WBB_34_004]
MELYNLFPTAIGFAGFNRALTDEELFFIQTLETRKNIGNTTSVDNFVLRNAALTELRAFIEDAVADYFHSTVNPKHNVNLRMTQSWCNYSEPGQHHHKHAHPNSFVSGVFYVQTNPDDRIYFYRDEWQQIKLPPETWNAYNSESWWFHVKAGQLILFPSSLPHMVQEVKGELVRISLSFNTFPVGTVGEEMELTGLRLEA